MQLTRLILWLLDLARKSPRAALWLLVVLQTTIYRTIYCAPINWTIDTWTGAWEESFKVGVRETYRFWYRLINSASVWLGALFLGGGWHRTGAAAWLDTGQTSESATWAQQQSTLNAVLARKATALREGACLRLALMLILQALACVCTAFVQPNTFQIQSRQL
jgi:hypothetical protein